MTGVQTGSSDLAVAQEEKATANFVAEEAVKSDEVSEETSE